MKRLYLFLLFLIVSTGMMAQPMLMNYQGVARDRSGKAVAGQNISLQIHILAGDVNNPPVYTEIHKTITSQFGVFNIHIGAGDPVEGNFNAIEWGLGNHYVKVEMDVRGGSNYKDLGTTQLLSVPYAFHAQTAGSVLEAEADPLKGAKPGVKSQVWSRFGNLETNPDKDKLGTTDESDLVVVTNNEEAMRILSNGDIDIVNSTAMGGNLHVEGESVLGGNLNVEGESVLEGNLQVGGGSVLKGNLQVEGPESVLEGNLHVKGESVTIDNNLYIGNNLNTGGLTVKDNAADKGEGGFVATFQNTNNEKGDGINIKLGKASANNGLSGIYLDAGISASQIEDMKNLIGCELPASGKFSILQNLVVEGIQADIKTYGGLTVGVGNMLTDFINAQLSLPLTIVPQVTVFPGFHLGMPSIAGVGIPDVNIPSQTIGPYSFPAIPEVSLSALGIDEINIREMGFWGIPDICLDDNVSNPLSNENEFVRFSDNANKRMGAIRAESVSDWAANYLTASYLLGLRGALVSTLDKQHARYHFKQKISEAVLAYTKIGVEYSSGNGDYAEWLERLDPAEKIGAGDVVGVTGGKITKDLMNAEQVMAVSHYPIVLGNVPEQERLHLGNNVAFMGQIPVKIMGPVASGDYIVGKGDIKGYGIAVAPQKMTVDDFRYVVGRSWDTNPEDGPKMVNTVVGIHNGDYVNILRQYEKRFKSSEDRLQALESKIEILTGSTAASK